MLFLIIISLLFIQDNLCDSIKEAQGIYTTDLLNITDDYQVNRIMNMTVNMRKFERVLVDIKDDNTTITAEVNRSRSFSIDATRGCFLLDGQPFTFVAGSMQYYRIPRQYWRDRMVMLKMSGLNTLHVSLEWSSHEPQQGVFNFKDELDMVEFIRIAHEEGLLVIVRPGPYIGYGRDFGGLPPWLLWEYPSLNFRRNDQDYMARVDIYLGEVLERLKPLFIEKGGPIFLLEICSEDPSHSTWLQKMYRKHVGARVGIITTGDHRPGPRSNSFSQYMRVLGFRIFDSFRELDTRVVYYSIHKIEPNGPMINTHFALGWPTLWTFPPNYLTTKKLRMLLEDSLQSKISISISAFHGGTDFGFKSGAWIMPSSGRYVPQITTHDVGAPLDEQGMPNAKFDVIREVLCQSHSLPPGEVPLPRQAFGYGPLVLRPVGCLLDSKVIRALTTSTANFKIPYTFEDLRQASGFVLYSTTISSAYSKPVLAVPQLRDRAQVYLNKRMVGVVDRSRSVLRLYLGQVNEGDMLQLLVENQGRVYLGGDESNVYYKGLSLNGEVYLEGERLRNWTMHGYPFEDVGQLQNYVARQDVFSETLCTPTIYSGRFQLLEGEQVPRDTFLDLTEWRKGVAFINGHNLGRYWPNAGPQESLYLPGCFLLPYPHINQLTLLELELLVQKTATVIFSETPKRYQVVKTANYTSLAMMVLMVCMLAMLTCYRKTLDWIYSIRGNNQV